MIEEIKKQLESTLDGFKDAYENYGYDLANERHYVETALKKVNLLLLHNVSQRCELLPEFLMKDSDGKIITAYHGGSDVTEEWNEYLVKCG